MPYSSTPVRNKEQKIDRLLSFMFLRRDSSVCPSVSSPVFLLLHFPLHHLFLLVLRTADISLSFVATHNKTNRGNSTRRAMGKEPGGTQKNAKETER